MGFEDLVQLGGCVQLAFCSVEEVMASGLVFLTREALLQVAASFEPDELAIRGLVYG